jgi:dUTP pyrophosphatase
MNFKIISKENTNLTKSIINKSLRIKYLYPDFPTLQINGNGDWIDLKCVEDYTLKAGESALINLGVAMKLPKGYEAHLVPRSGTFNKYGLMQTNSMGIIDNSYSGNNDIWKMPVYATRDVTILKGERLCQFRLMPTMSNMTRLEAISYLIIETDNLDSIDRGGFGSTGR